MSKGPSAKPRDLSELARGVAAVKAGADPAVAYREAIGEGMTLAIFTEKELHELKRVCRDADSELGRRYLTAGLDRANPKPAMRPVDGLR